MVNFFNFVCHVDIIGSGEFFGLVYLFDPLDLFFNAQVDEGGMFLFLRTIRKYVYYLHELP